MDTHGSSDARPAVGRGQRRGRACRVERQATDRRGGARGRRLAPRPHRGRPRGQQRQGRRDAGGRPPGGQAGSEGARLRSRARRPDRSHRDLDRATSERCPRKGATHGGLAIGDVERPWRPEGHARGDREREGRGHRRRQVALPARRLRVRRGAPAGSDRRYHLAHNSGRRRRRRGGSCEERAPRSLGQRTGTVAPSGGGQARRNGPRRRRRAARAGPDGNPASQGHTGGGRSPVSRPRRLRVGGDRRERGLGAPTQRARLRDRPRRSRTGRPGPPRFRPRRDRPVGSPFRPRPGPAGGGRLAAGGGWGRHARRRGARRPR